MADTVLTELKIHEFDSVEQMSQYESEIGENDMVYTPDTSIRLPILTPMWFDHQVNDESWLNADTFSWQSGDVYKTAYEHLANEFRTTVQFYAWDNAKSTIIYTTSATPSVGDPVYDADGVQKDTVVSVSGSALNTTEGYSGTDWVRASGDDFSMDASKNETIGNITITYYLAQDGHKICLPDQESNLVTLYESTGVAWYYILDTANKQFKLPREKPMSGMVVGNGELGIINANVSNPASATVSTVWQSGASGNPLVLANTSIASAGTALGVSGDGKKSGLAVERISDNRYLYFWVGAFDQTATEQTAGLNAEMFNGKADVDLNNTTNGAKELMANSSMPSGTYTNLTLGASGATYTAPADGWVAINKVGTSSGQWVSITCNNLGSQSSVQGANGTGVCYLPVKKGDEFKVSYSLSGTTNFFRFIYAEGCKHLA